MASRLLVMVLGAVVLSAEAQPNYYSMEKCHATGSTVSVVFRGKFGEVRRLLLERRKIELSGDVKGSSAIQNVHELKLHPRLEVTYKGGWRVEFGPLTPDCREKMKRLANELSVNVGGNEG